MKTILIMVMAVSITIAANAQISSVTIQASGLTCSMCSNAINQALKALPFVKQVTANVKTSSFELHFKNDSTVDIDALKNAVEDAGFFVARFTATMQFNNVAVKNDAHITVGSTVFHFLNVKDQTINGNKTIRLLDKNFVTAKEFKKNAGLTKKQCYQTGKAGGCCAADGLATGTRIFHVTI